MSTILYYYVDSARSPVGPVDKAELHNLVQEAEINGATLLVAEGDQEWRKLIEIFPELIVPAIPQATGIGAPPVPPLREPSPYNHPSEVGLNSAARAKGSLFSPGWRVVSDELWLAFIIASALSLIFELIMVANDHVNGSGLMFAALLSLVCCAILMVIHYRCWSILPQNVRETSPAFATWGMLIPFFGFYWVFKSYKGLVRGVKSWEAQQGITYENATEKSSVFQATIEYLAMAQGVLFALSGFCLLAGAVVIPLPILAASITHALMFYYKVLNRLDALASSNA